MDRRDEEIAKKERRLQCEKERIQKQWERLKEVRSKEECSPDVAITLYRSCIEGILRREQFAMERGWESVEKEKKLAKEREQRRHC